MTGLMDESWVCRPEEVVFTRNATEGLNIVAQAWGGKHLKPGDEVGASRRSRHMTGRRRHSWRSWGE